MQKFEIAKKETFGFEPKPLRVYTPADFPKIHAKLSCYWENGVMNQAKFLIDCGALTEKGAVIVKNYRYEKTATGEMHGNYDIPVRLEEAYNLLNWYLPESSCYPKMDVQMEMEQLKKRTSFEVRPLTDAEKNGEPF